LSIKGSKLTLKLLASAAAALLPCIASAQASDPANWVRGITVPLESMLSQASANPATVIGKKATYVAYVGMITYEKGMHIVGLALHPSLRVSFQDARVAFCAMPQTQVAKLKLGDRATFALEIKGLDRPVVPINRFNPSPQNNRINATHVVAACSLQSEPIGMTQSGVDPKIAAIKGPGSGYEACLAQKEADFKRRGVAMDRVDFMEAQTVCSKDNP
jgi:hypothetical protein